MTGQPQVVATDEARLPEARALARRLALPLVRDLPPGGLVLEVGERLRLRQLGPAAPGPVEVDFVAGAAGHRRRFGGGRGQLVARAVGMKRGEPPGVIDATAGLGRDAFVLATLGCRVEMVERSAVIAALLEDGLRRARENEETAPIVARMTLHRGEARERLESLVAATGATVVCLDPMFPGRDKAALVKKEMRLFKALLGSEEGEAPALLEAALASGARRVVVKRPRKAPEVGGAAPDLRFEGKSTRFDVYLPGR